MDRDINILGYLPPKLQEFIELIAINGIENPVLRREWLLIEETLNNQFIMTANEAGAKRYEKMLSVNVPATDTIETRRFRLFTIFNEQAPYTNNVMKQLLDGLLGKGQYVLNRDVANKTLSVKIELNVKGQFDAVKVMLERITPQNMILTVELRYNQYSKLAQYTHTQLSAYTHKQLREEVFS